MFAIHNTRQYEGRKNKKKNQKQTKPQFFFFKQIH